MKTEGRVRSRPCTSCNQHFRHKEMLWAFDCFGNPAIGCHSRRGIWYGLRKPDWPLTDEEPGNPVSLSEPARTEEFRLEEPILVWTSAAAPGVPPICDDCVAARDFDGELDDVV